MTRQDQIIKWLIYTLGLLPIWILDAFLLGRWPVWGVKPNLLLLAAVSVAVLEGAQAGTGFGLAVGLLWELAYPGGFGGLVLFMALAGMLIGTVSQLVLSQSAIGCLVCSGAVFLALDGLRIFRGLINNTANVSSMLEVAVPEVLLSLVWTLPIWLLFRFIFNRVGGDKLA